MHFFDREFLARYLDQGISPKIFVDKQYYTITDLSDLISTTGGIAYDLNGKEHDFNYVDIENVMVGDRIVDRDVLKRISKGETGDEEDAEADGGDAGGEFGGDGGGDIGGDSPGGDTGGGDTGGGDKPEQFELPAGAGEEDEGPPEESITPRDLVGMMLSENSDISSKCGISKGDFVKNIDNACEFYGSVGTVTSVDEYNEDADIAMIEYRVFNVGFNFKPGDKKVKLSSELEKIDQ